MYTGLSRDAFRSIVTTAREKQMPVAGHVPRAVALDEVLNGGIASIEHLADYASAIEADESPFKGKGCRVSCSERSNPHGHRHAQPVCRAWILTPR